MDMILGLLKGMAIGAGVAATIVVAALVVMAFVWRRRLNASKAAVPPPVVGPVSVQPPTVAPVKHRGYRWLNPLCQCLLFALIFWVPAALIAPEIFGVIPKLREVLSRISPFIRWVYAAWWFFPCWMKVNSYKGVVIAFLGKTWRDRPEGPTWIFRPLFISFEAAVRESTMDRGSIPYKLDAQAENRDNIPMRGLLNYSLKCGSLRQYHWMTADERKKSLTGWVEHFMSIEVKKYKNRDVVEKAIGPISDAVTVAMKTAWVGGMMLEEYFGILIDKVTVADPEQPQAIKDAEVKREAAQEEAKAKDVIHRNFMKRVRAIQKNAVDNGEPAVPFEKAAETIQLNDGIIQKTVKHIDFGKNISGMVNGVGKGIADAGGSIAKSLEKILS